MSEMVTRVARAMYAKRTSKFGVPHGRILRFDELSDFQRDAEMDTARAAIEAMREPTELMLDAFHDGLHNCPDDRFSECATAGYRAMIDAALQGAETGK